jgi:CheY-like chemotaxis protein
MNSRPKTIDSRRPYSAGSPRKRMRSGPGCVLIVEDHDDTRLMLRTILEMSGFSVLEAIDGEAAIEAAAEECPDVILMDLGMPTVDGMGAMRRIREHKTIGETPIVFLTGWAESRAREAALSAGCNDYLVKPIELDQVISVIERWLPRQARSMAAAQASLNEVGT